MGCMCRNSNEFTLENNVTEIKRKVLVCCSRSSNTSSSDSSSKMSSNNSNSGYCGGGSLDGNENGQLAH